MSEKNPKVYVIHENEEWVQALFLHLNQMDVPFENWFINHGKVNLNETPPDGVFYNRMSASSHTRDHRYAIELAESLLSWLELHDRKVINGRNALSLEVRKAEQHLHLSKFGIATPKTIVVNNKDDLRSAAVDLNLFPFIVKPNRGGKGTGVKLYNNLNQLKQDIELDQFPKSLDGILLVQEYIRPVNDRIIRTEFIGGKFYYAVSVDSSGGFELCPADACELETSFCPTDNTAPKFKIIDDYINPDIPKYEEFLKACGIEIGALEYVVSDLGNRYVYDVNTNTNYNASAELDLQNKYQGMQRIAGFLKEELLTFNRGLRIAQ